MKCITANCKNETQQGSGQFMIITSEDTRTVWICLPCWTKLTCKGFNTIAPELLACLQDIADKIDRNSGSPVFTADEHESIETLLICNDE